MTTIAKADRDLRRKLEAIRDPKLRRECLRAFDDVTPHTEPEEEARRRVAPGAARMSPPADSFRWGTWLQVLGREVQAETPGEQRRSPALSPRNVGDARRYGTGQR